jgi:ABC-2 type transport system permease protein
MIARPFVRYAIYEISTLLRHPEQLLLVLGTPIAVLVLLPEQPHVFDFTLAACSLASSFTSLVISTAFARRYGTLKYLSVTPLGLRGVVSGQTLVGIFLLAIQIPIVIATSLILEISIQFNTLNFISVPLLVLLFTQSAFLLAGVLTAEKVLAFSNLLFLAILISGVGLLQNDFSFMHPLAGATVFQAKGLSYLVSLIIFNTGLNILLRKYFKWLD